MSLSRSTLPTAEDLRSNWGDSPRWRGIERTYRPEDVIRLRGNDRGRTLHCPTDIAEKLWRYLNDKPFVNSLGALTGNQAMQQVRAGLDAIYLSGWQVAGDANLAGEMYPDQSLYPADSVPAVVRRINATLKRADELHHAEGDDSIDWFKPIVADAEAGFGGVLNAFELMKQMIDAGAAGVHFEDQLSSAKKCGHMGGKVLVPTQEAVNTSSRRLDSRPTSATGRRYSCLGPTPNQLSLLIADVDERDRPFIDKSKGRSSEGFFYVKAGLEPGDRARPVVCAVRRPAVVRDGQARPAGSQALRGSHPREVPGQAARLQLLAIVQLEAQARRRHDREVPARVGRDGLQVPVHHTGWLPRPQLLDVRAGPRLQGAADDGVRCPATGRIRR